MRNLFGLPEPDVAVDDGSDAARFRLLARHLEALASETRLELLYALRTPKQLGHIRVAAGLVREGESPDRPLSRQGVTRHLDQLKEAGLVNRIPGSSGTDQYVLNHERLFAMVDELRTLAKLRSSLSGPASQTIDRSGADEADLPAGPRLLLAYGRDDGVAFALPEKPPGKVRIGRGASCEIRLDYDPYLSGTHCVVENTGKGFQVQDQGSKNGTFVNWSRLSSGGARAMVPGDLLSVGRSILVFQP